MIEARNSLFTALMDLTTDAVLVLAMDGTILDANPAVSALLDTSLDALIGTSLTECAGFYPVRFLANCARVAQSAASESFRATLCPTHATPLSCAVRARLVPYPDGRSPEGKAMLVVLTPIETPAGHNAEVARQLAELASLREVAMQFTADLDLDRLLSTIVTQAMLLMEAEAGGLYLHDPERDVIVRTVSVGDFSPVVGTVRRRGEGLAGEVWERGASLRVDNYLDWEGHPPLPNDPVPQAALGVPVRRGDEFFGILSVSALLEHRPPFTAADESLLTLVAAQAALALHNARIYDEANRLRVFNERLIQSMTEGLGMENEAGVFTFVNPAGAEILGYTAEELVGQHHDLFIPPDQRAIVEAEDARRRCGESGRYRIELVRKDGERFPAMVGGAPRFDETGAFAGTVAVFTDITDRVAAEQAMLHRLRLEHLLTTLSTEFINLEVSETDAAIERALETVTQAIGGDRAFLFPFEGKGNYDPPPYAWHASGAELPKNWTDFLDSAHYEWWLSQLRRLDNIVIPSVDKLPPEAHHERALLRNNHVRSAVAVPLSTGGALTGFLAVTTVHKERDWPEADVAWLRVTAEVLAGALARRRATTLLHQQARRLAFVNALGSAIAATLDPDEITMIVYRALGQVLDVATLIITAYDADRQEITPLCVVADGERQPILCLPPMQLNAERGIHSRTIVEQRTIRLDDVQTQKSSLATGVIVMTSDPRMPRALLTAPIIVKGEVMGTVQLQSHQKGAYQPEDGQLLSAVANQVGLAIQNVRLLDAQRVQAQRLWEVMQSVPDGVLLVDAEGRLLLANDTAERALARTATYASDGRLATLGGEPWQHWLNSPEPGGWHVIEGEGPPAWTFELIVRPSAARDGATTAWVIVIRDVTDKRLIEERALQHERLAAVGQLAAGIAHDFNNIMAVVVLYAQLCQNDPTIGSRARSRLDTIVSQARHATGLIDQMLDFSRSSALERRPLDLCLLMNQLVKLLERTLPESIQLEFIYGRDTYTVNADPTRIQQAVMNLALNARDAMPDGGRLMFTLDRFDLAPGARSPLPEMHPGPWVCLAVRDTGSGIASEVLSHMFVPFFTTKPPGKGTGLGLAQVHGIVKQHNGEVGVDSVAGAGATFTIYLPALVDSAVELVGWAVNASAEPGVEIPQGAGETILVVEDNAATRASLIDTLETLNYATLEAADGQAALDLVDQYGDQIALVLSDLVMPDMGGKALLASLRARGSSVPFVVLSGHGLAQEEAALTELGAAGWAAKPIQMQPLAELVARGIGQHLGKRPQHNKFP